MQNGSVGIRFLSCDEIELIATPSVVEINPHSSSVQSLSLSLSFRMGFKRVDNWLVQCMINSDEKTNADDSDVHHDGKIIRQCST